MTVSRTRISDARRRVQQSVVGASPAPTKWILLMPKIPNSPAYTRVKIWRRLQAIGAVMLKNSVYVLPNREECVESFQWLAKELAEVGGQASLCEGFFFDGVTDDEIERLFIDARNADYAELAEEARKLAKELRPRQGAKEALLSLEAQAGKLRKRLDEIIAIDFCHASGRESAEGLVVSLFDRLAAVRSPSAAKNEPLAKIPKPQKRTWVTRTGVHVDRIASAWLIRRFIDPDATLKFVPAKGYVPEPGELRFDMYDAEFTHDGDRCTFEVLLERMGIEDAALRAVGEIVHDIDLRDEKFGREETAGVRSSLTGLCVVHRDDMARITAGTGLFDSLYAFFSLRPSGKKGRT
jgi:hypothetical protein